VGSLPSSLLIMGVVSRLNEDIPHLLLNPRLLLLLLLLLLDEQLLTGGALRTTAVTTTGCTAVGTGALRALLRFHGTCGIGNGFEILGGPDWLVDASDV
jgi:hypothetical protein